MAAKDSQKQTRAIALEVSNLEELPRITAAGVGEIAKQILGLAKEHKIPIHSDQELTELLGQAKVSTIIDSKTLRLIAEVITFLYYSEKEWQQSHSFLDGILNKDLSLPPNDDSL